MSLQSLILAIETSCDETACAILKDGTDVLANVISSQINIHEKFGGVVPEVASRKHLEYMPLLVEEAVSEAACRWEDIDAVAVTFGPGLVGALLVGLSHAKALALGLGVPLIGVHHIEGHIYANFLAHGHIELPAVCLVVSGGHTNLIRLPRHGVYEVLGRTQDDAAGEAFDKVARAIGLGYPGGPKIDALSKEGDPAAIDFPRAQTKGPYDFSFSGLKSAVLNFTNQEKMKGRPLEVANIAASFQEAVVDALVDKTMAALDDTASPTLLLAGGVAANRRLRARLSQACAEKGVAFYYPPMDLCTDNAAMIAAAAAYKYERKEFSGWDLNAVPQLPFSQYVENSALAK